MTHQIAIITGGSRGLGKNAALHLAQKSIDSIITYNSNQAEAEKVVEAVKQLGARAVALQLDTSSVQVFDQFVRQVQGSLKQHWQTEHFHFLVNNAGIG